MIDPPIELLAEGSHPQLPELHTSLLVTIPSNYNKVQAENSLNSFQVFIQVGYPRMQ